MYTEEGDYAVSKACGEVLSNKAILPNNVDDELRVFEIVEMIQKRVKELGQEKINQSKYTGNMIKGFDEVTDTVVRDYIYGRVCDEIEGDPKLKGKGNFFGPPSISPKPLPGDKLTMKQKIQYSNPAPNGGVVDQCEFEFTKSSPKMGSKDILLPWEVIPTAGLNLAQHPNPVDLSNSISSESPEASKTRCHFK